MEPTDGSTQSETLLPNLVIIGGMKCGTTSLHSFLDQHPDVFMSRRKEVNFFVDGHVSRGLDWYTSHFEPAPVRGESSPSYTTHPQRQGVPELMYSILPKARLIYLVRDPIERAVSHFLHEYQRNREDRQIDRAITDVGENPYVAASMYHMQLMRYLAFYPRDQILVVQTESLRDDPDRVLRTITDFLSIDPFAFDVSHWENVSERRGKSGPLGRILESRRGKKVGRHLPRSAVRLAKRMNAALSRPTKRPSLSADSRAWLERTLGEDADALRGLTGLPLEGWPV